MNDTLIHSVEFVLALIVIPFNVWVASSIFTLREEVHIMRREVDLLDEIKNLVAGRAN